jgi:hypothetical protein
MMGHPYLVDCLMMAGYFAMVCALLKDIDKPLRTSRRTKVRD